MNWAWATPIEQLWRSPSLPTWLTLAAAGFFAIILLVTLLRAEKSVANGALTVITLLAIGVAAAATIRGFGPNNGTSSRGTDAPAPAISAAIPALSCLDELAGETVLTACEKTLFGSAEAVAAAVSYVAARITLLTALGDVASANKAKSPELERLRRSIERDRYGLVAFVLSARDHCQPAECAAYQSLADHSQITTNMDERVYEAAILRYSPSWNAPSTPPAPVVVGLAPAGTPTGKPTNADFPTSASIPPVNIMTPEPPPATVAAPAPAKPPAAAAHAQAFPAPRPAQAAQKKPSAPKPRTAAPVQLAPAVPSPDN